MVTENHALSHLPDGRHRILFMENFSSHTIGESLHAALEGKNTELRFLPPKQTHLLQPTNSFVLQKIEEAWSDHG